MRLSSLQKFILLECLNSRLGRISRWRLGRFYDKINSEIKEKARTKNITKSIERLIDREFLVGFGEKTSQRWYIKEIKLTRQGKKVARKLLGEQMALPFSGKLDNKKQLTKFKKIER